MQLQRVSSFTQLIALVALISACAIDPTHFEPLPLIEVRFEVPQAKASCIASDVDWQCSHQSQPQATQCERTAHDGYACLLSTKLGPRAQQVWQHILLHLVVEERPGMTCLDLGIGGMQECIPHPEQPLVSVDLTSNKCQEGTPDNPLPPSHPESIWEGHCRGNP